MKLTSYTLRGSIKGTQAISLETSRHQFLPEVDGQEAEGVVRNGNTTGNPPAAAGDPRKVKRRQAVEVLKVCIQFQDFGDGGNELLFTIFDLVWGGCH